MGGHVSTSQSNITRSNVDETGSIQMSNDQNEFLLYKDIAVRNGSMVQPSDARDDLRSMDRGVSGADVYR